MNTLEKPIELSRTRVEVKSIYQADWQLLCRITGLSEEQMFWAVWEEGMNFLQVECRGYQPAIDELKHEAFYWNWWKEHWYQRNAGFISYHTLSTFVDPQARRPDVVLKAYIKWHRTRIESEELCRSYMHLISSTQSYWRKKP